MREYIKDMIFFVGVGLVLLAAAYGAFQMFVTLFG
jgi:hypothetical protein